MSVKIQLDKLSTIEKKEIEKTLTVPVFNKNVCVFQICNNFLYLPFYYGKEKFESLIQETEIENKEVNKEKNKEVFLGVLRPLQKQVHDDVLNVLKKEGSIIISAEPGFGKTITSVSLICSINVPTIIFIKQTIIAEQWVKEINRYAPNKKILNILSGKKIDRTADIYIVNPVVLKKSIEETVFTLEDFSHIKFVIVDELHQIVSKILHKAFFKFQPQYLLGLSATPYRPKEDPFGPAISWFFGNKVIGNKLFRKHSVYCIKTNFEPEEIRKQPNTGNLDWNYVLSSQAENVKRNQLIVKSVCKFPEKTWLILVKRVVHAKILQDLFKEKGYTAETITGSKSDFDKNCKILIGTTPKVGVGFDHSPIDALCMAADVVEYFEQFLGRCMRRQDIHPIVLDFEDKFKPLKKHFKKRLSEYVKHGGEIIFENEKNINLEKNSSSIISVPSRVRQFY